MDQILKHPFVNLSTCDNEKKQQQQPVIQTEKERESKPELTQKKQSEPPQQSEQSQQEPPKPSQVEEDKQPAPDINSYTFRSEVAKKFAKQLGSNLHRDELTNIMREVEQTHNSMQQKLKQSTNSKHSSSESKLQQTIKELHLIHTNVEQRLDDQQQQQQSKHKVEQRHAPHNN